MSRAETAALLREHGRAGGHVDTSAGPIFVRQEGEGPPVVLMHGVPVSSLLYRHVLPLLAAQGLRGIAFDLLGCGLSARPAGGDYSWSGLGRIATETIQALELERFHLVVHDIGGPVGFEVAAAMPDRIASLTILDTIVEVDQFRRPWTMEPFAWRGIGPLVLATTPPPAFRALMRLQGVGDGSRVPGAALDAHLRMLRREDGGRAFLKVMRGFERTPEKAALYRGVVGDARYPRQVVWATRDPALRLAREGVIAQRAAGVDQIYEIDAKHFPQEDRPQELADRIAAFVLASQGA